MSSDLSEATLAVKASKKKVQTSIPLSQQNTKKKVDKRELPRDVGDFVVFSSFSVSGEGDPSNRFSLVFSRGSVVNFSYGTDDSKKSAIVNAANEGCITGGGVDGAVTEAGGPALRKDRRALPVVGLVRCTDGFETWDEKVRCPTGDAKITGPGSYGVLHVPYVIHAVGPNYFAVQSEEEGDGLLRSAYLASMEKAREAKIESLAFCLLSCGVFRGRKSLGDVILIGVEAISGYCGYPELKEVHMFAFTTEEALCLTEAARHLALVEG